MKLSKLLLAAVGVTVLLGAVASAASARNFSLSSQTNTALWTLASFTGGFGTVECELKLSGSFHTRTYAKVINSLIGYITEGTVLRCARGGATVIQASLPWHRGYGPFAGTLPNITGLTETVTGFEAKLREPTFGVICTIPASAIRRTFTVVSGVITRVDLSGSYLCDGLTGMMSGSTTNVTNGSGARITLTLI